MILRLHPGAGAREMGAILTAITDRGFTPRICRGDDGTIVAAVGPGADAALGDLSNHPGVACVVRSSVPFLLASREFRSANTVIEVNGLAIGGPDVVLIAGPCAVESREQLLAVAGALSLCGVRLLRGGAFKPRTSPYSFRGLGPYGLELLREAATLHGMGIVTEVLTPRDVEVVSACADILQIGARNMQNFDLLEAVGDSERPVLLKRGLSATIEEWLMAAEYVLARGNERVILCERGVRTFERATRNTLDVAAIPVVHHLSHLPVIADPSHATGARRYVLSAARAAVAAGADGLLVEVHPDPDHALSDGQQSLTPEDLHQLQVACRAVAAALGRRLV